MLRPREAIPAAALVLSAGVSAPAGDHTPDTRGFTGLVLMKEGRDLGWRNGGSGHTGRYVK